MLTVLGGLAEFERELIRARDFFLRRSFRNLDDLNGQLADWLDTVANVRLHGTTQRIVSGGFRGLRERIAALRRSQRRPVTRELRERGYLGAYTAVNVTVAVTAVDRRRLGAIIEHPQRPSEACLAGRDRSGRRRWPRSGYAKPTRSSNEIRLALSCRCSRVGVPPTASGKVGFTRA